METQPNQSFDLLTVKDAASYLRLSEMTILRLAGQGIIPGAKIGRQWRFQKEDVLNLVRKLGVLSRGSEENLR